MHGSTIFTSLIAGSAFFLSAAATAQQDDATMETDDSSVSFTVTAGGAYQFNTDLDSGGDYEVTRYEAAIRARWSLNADSNLTFRLGYGVDDYEFTGTTGFASVNPWDDVHTTTLAVIYDRELSDDWRIFAGPRVISSRETGASFSDSVTAGGVVGVSWSQTPDLRLGFGIGVFSQLEDDAKVFPSFIIDWHIDDRWRLTSQGGTVIGGISGLELTYALGNGWEASVGGSYRFKRFRLDDDPAAFAPDGVGEETSIPIWVRASYEVTNDAEIGAFVGIATGSQVDVEDLNGALLRTDDADNGFFAGIYGRLRF